MLSYALQTTGLFTGIVRSGTLAENSFNSVERLKYYSEVDLEEPDRGDAIGMRKQLDKAQDVPIDWPSEGHVEFRSVSLKYRDDLPPVLSDLSVNFPSRKKTG